MTIFALFGKMPLEGRLVWAWLGASTVAIVVSFLAQKSHKVHYVLRACGLAFFLVLPEWHVNLLDPARHAYAYDFFLVSIAGALVFLWPIRKASDEPKQDLEQNKENSTHS